MLMRRCTAQNRVPASIARHSQHFRMNYPVPPCIDSPEHRVQCEALRPVQDDAHDLGLARGKCGAQRPAGTQCFNVESYE
jgi:hypothetical protein